MVGWNFPSNGGGAINGVADSGIEIFRGKEIPSLAREICQNSLDAVNDESKPVTVEFQRHEINSTDFPDVRSFQMILKACLNFWNKKSEKTEAFIKQANLKLRSSQTAVLRISDFNTTGLAEPFNSRAMTGWNTLTKINGGAIKSDDKAGNFGIGKNAPFANSFFRTVCYRTFNTKGERAAQAVAKLVSFDLDSWNVAAGTGYFGDMQGNMPVTSIAALDNIYRRTKRGTDVFIYGFNGQSDWATELVDELIENFLVAIYRDKLRLKVQDSVLDKQSLGKFVKDNAANYHKILTGDDAVEFRECDFHDMGKLKLGVLLDPTAKLNRRVLIVRKSGMKLFELDRFSRTLNFTAILELDGFKLNAFFRQMETPDHTNWEPTRHPTFPARAKQYLSELKRWVRDTISSLGAENTSDVIDVKGLSRMLDFDDAAVGGNSNRVETLDNPAPQENSVQKLSGANNDPPKIWTLGGSNNSGKKHTPGARQPKPDTGTKKLPPNPSGEKNPVMQPVACDKVRVIKIGDKKYRLIIRIDRNISRGRLEIFAVGENGSRDKLSVMRARADNPNVQTLTVDDDIKFANLRGGVDAKISFELADEKNYALGVAVYED